MKLTYEDKKQIYKLRQKVYSLIDLSKKFKIHKRNIEYILNLANKYGEEIKSFATNDRKQVIKDSTAYIMTSMLRNVVYGTAQNAGVSGVDLAVKTGTTTFGTAEAQKFGFDIDNAAKDSWVIGYTSNYTLSVWQGFDTIENSTNFLSQADTQKTQALFRINMQNINRIHPAKGFTVPRNVGSVNGSVKIMSEEEQRALQEAQREAAQRNRNNRDNDDANNENNSNTNTNNNNNSNNASNTPLLPNNNPNNNATNPNNNNNRNNN